MFDYGKVYSRLPIKKFGVINSKLHLRGIFLYLAKIYFLLFGYPDVASQARYRIVVKLVKPMRKDKILDAGCGNGIYVHEFTDRFGASCWGVDARSERVLVARKISRQLGHNNSFRTSLLESYNISRQRFDKILCLEVLEHIENDALVLKKFFRYLNRGGLLVVSVPIVGTALTRKQQEDPKFRPRPFEHVRSGYVQKELITLAHNAGFKKISIKPYFFLVSRYAVKFQQYLYKNRKTALNLIFSPLLATLTYLDEIIKYSPRGYIMILRK